MKRMISIFLFCLLCLSTVAQVKWINPMEVGFPVIQNQGWSGEIGYQYVRLPDRAKQSVRQPLWDLSRHSAGLAIHFYSSSPQLKIRYVVEGAFDMPHMPSTGVSGIDLYSINSDGRWSLCSGFYSFGDTIQYSFSNLGKDRYHHRGFEYRLYLPLYNSVKWMEIGVLENAELTFIPQSLERPIVLYGTSIAQGACASRPAMAWSSILQRSLDWPLMNLGFSGNGKLEKEMLNYVSETDACLYILDCLPNLPAENEQKVTDLVVAAVKQIRATRTAPILLIEHAGYSNALTNSGQYDSYTRLNRASRRGYEALKTEGVKDLYYLSQEELNFPSDAWVDYVHPSDFGMVQQATVVEKKVREILKLPVGNFSTTRPVTQRREPDTYEWRARHCEILAHHQQTPSKSVILGNSITNYWGGEPLAPRQNGPKSWERFMRPQGYYNLGYGWDRIENVLWRVYHGELDGYDAQKVVLMIGTNNMGLNSDEEIVEGLRFLLAAIRERQPKASIKVMGILPRRGQEEWVKGINQKIEEMARQNAYKYADVSVLLLQSDGRINESFFLDGLHPNEKGYQLIGKEIAL
ncbi:MAG: SGNH/GDSL hydrolase family protein [Odoribacter sp.]